MAPIDARLEWLKHRSCQLLDVPPTLFDPLLQDAAGAALFKDFVNGGALAGAIQNGQEAGNPDNCCKGAWLSCRQGLFRSCVRPSRVLVPPTPRRHRVSRSGCRWGTLQADHKMHVNLEPPQRTLVCADCTNRRNCRSRFPGSHGLSRHSLAPLLCRAALAKTLGNQDAGDSSDLVGPRAPDRRGPRLPSHRRQQGGCSACCGAESGPQAGRPHVPRAQQAAQVRRDSSGELPCSPRSLAGCLAGAGPAAWDLQTAPRRATAHACGGSRE